MAGKKKGEPRSPRHDELVVNLVHRLKSEPRALAKFILSGSPDDASQYEFERIEIEKPCGFCFADICVHGSVGYTDVKILIEVKTEVEIWSAGDVIRQLKGYRRDIVRAYGKNNVCVPLCFHCARDLTPIEKELFAHEKITVVT